MSDAHLSPPLRRGLSEAIWQRIAAVTQMVDDHCPIFRDRPICNTLCLGCDGRGECCLKRLLTMDDPL